MESKLIEVDIESIRPNLRLIYAGETIAKLCLSIKTQGQVEPIQVWFDGEFLRIQDGEIRWRACKLLGMRRVKALLVEF